MKSLLFPKNIAVVGASRNPEKIGYIVFDNLLTGFGQGKVFGINPKADLILGEKIYPTVLDVKEKIDLAVITVPQEVVLRSLESCGKKGVKTAIVITSGFSESGASGQEKEKEILSIAKKFKMKILGPNCLGVINNFTGLNASFATSKLPNKYRVGIFSQSGAMGAAILDFANGNDFGFSYFVSLGNKSDISETDLITAWTEDENVLVGVGYLEDIKNGALFLKEAKKFTAKKPLILLKGGMTTEGRKAASLHTAALAQDDKVFEAAMEEAGVIIARNLNDLFEMAMAFSGNNLPKGKNLAIISNAGGPSVLAADACSKEGVKLPEFCAYTTHHLLSQTKASSVANPIDLRGDAKKEDFRLAFDLAQKDPAIDGILAIVTPQAMTEVEAIAWEAVLAKKRGKKPILLNLIGGEHIKKAREICIENGVTVFPFPERAIRTFSFMASFAGKGKTGNSKSPKKHSKHPVAKSLISFSGHKMSQSRLFRLLNLYGIPMAETVLVKSTEEAEKALEIIKPPVVMKIASEEIAHKTDIGGVIVGVQAKEEAAVAYQKILENVRKHLPHAKIEGVTVMEMAKEGLELFLGAKNDPVFGPTILFGFGGIFVELISDIKLVVAPFSERKIRNLIEKTAVSKVIAGYRGDSYDRKELIKVIMSLGQLISDHPEIRELEINPLILEEKGRGVLGLDAKIEIEPTSFRH